MRLRSKTYSTQHLCSCIVLFVDEYEKQQWQAQQEVYDAELEKQRDKDRKAKQRRARNAKRKLERLKHKLSETGELTDWEEEFSDSVTERLEKYGSAFQDPEKGRRSEALSFAQKKVLSSLNKKAKGLKRSGFKSKSKFIPNVRQIDDLDQDPLEEILTDKAKKPFLRLVKSGEKKCPPSLKQTG